MQDNQVTRSSAAGQAGQAVEGEYTGTDQQRMGMR